MTDGPDTITLLPTKAPVSAGLTPYSSRDRTRRCLQPNATAGGQIQPLLLIRLRSSVYVFAFALLLTTDRPPEFASIVSQFVPRRRLNSVDRRALRKSPMPPISAKYTQQHNCGSDRSRSKRY